MKARATPRYPWGDEATPGGRWAGNVWQGDFPHRDDAEDGHDYLAPVGSYAANAFGVHDLGGNVWEWCEDWFRPGGAGGEKVLKGGSWLCAASYCEGYRNTNRNRSAPDSGLDNTGFRCARSLEANRADTAERDPALPRDASAVASAKAGGD